MKRRHIALIPARGGSKGIPRKNLKLLGGHSLVAWAVQAAKNSQSFDNIVVSTDDLEIATHAVKYGAEVPFLRPKEYSGDDSKQLDTVRHVLEFYQGAGVSFSSVTILQPTSPFRTGDDCKRALKLFENSQENSVISICEYSHVQLTNLYLGTPESLKILGEQVAEGTLRQELPKIWWRNGALYVIAPSTILEKHSLYSEHILGYEMPYWQSHNIDNFSDLEEARRALTDRRISELKKNLFNSY